MTTNFEGIFSDCYKRATNTRIEGKDFFDSFYDRFTSTSDEVRAKIDVIDLSELKGPPLVTS